MEYKFNEIEKKWQDYWKEKKTYQVSNDSDKPKYYVLDMFPYPSGSGLHVGHPLGYIASDIFARFKRLKGFNVLHPMGFDSFGLPAEQYALETGQHPAETTKNNIATFKNQLDKIGFCYDWDREVRTSEPAYYKWTQWIFLQLFNSYFDKKENKAKPIAELIKIFEAEGNNKLQTTNHKPFSANEWKAFDEPKQLSILMDYRLAYCGYGEVNWCEALGTVLANDEVVNGVSERGGHPVVKKKLRQWYLRITEYADRLLEDLSRVEFSDAMKEMQSNWIGKSSGAEIDFEIKTMDDRRQGTNEQQSSVVEGRRSLRVYTTRPDTIFGVDFMVVAPELDLINEIKTPGQTKEVEDYIAYVKSRSERERMAEKKISGCFTGAYAVNPFDGREIPIWISEYVLAGYGTGAIMAVPCGDERDHKFAKHFNIPITNIIGSFYNGEEANPTKEATLENSSFLNSLLMKDAIDVAINKIEEEGIGVRKVNYKMRDAAFSRQRYWGEPFPIVWKDGTAYPLDEKELPLELPHVETYKPGPDGEGPLANIPEWVAKELETNTMPGYAGSSWYFLRYMDPHNDKAFCDRKVSDYWNQVDLYIGGTEHAVGHLLYSRMWTKVLFDLNLIGHDEPYKKLVNQGMITGVSEKLIRASSSDFDEPNELDIPNKSTSASTSFWVNWIENKLPFSIQIDDGEDFYVINHSVELKGYSLFGESLINVPIEFVNESVLDINEYSKEKSNINQPKKTPEVFVCKEGFYNSKTGKWFDFDKIEITPLQFKTIPVVEKMSKSKRNVVNPDDIINKYGADTFRMYEMFLGPVEMSKPWDTKGIEGVYRFLKKLWRLFYDEMKGKMWNEEKATDAELKVLHKTIKKIEEDTERFSFNTAVSTFMICVNELADLKCHKKEILEPLLILLAPYAPHIAEELYNNLHSSHVSPTGGDLEGASVLDAAFPAFNPALLVESSKEYPISINGKVRANLSLSLDLDQKQVEEIILQNEIVMKWLEGNPPKKIIYVKNKMINVVI